MTLPTPPHSAASEAALELERARKELIDERARAQVRPRLVHTQACCALLTGERLMLPSCAGHNHRSQAGVCRGEGANARGSRGCFALATSSLNNSTSLSVKIRLEAQT
jgi:hypothetical protein